MCVYGAGDILHTLDLDKYAVDIWRRHTPGRVARAQGENQIKKYNPNRYRETKEKKNSTTSNKIDRSQK